MTAPNKQRTFFGTTIENAFAHFLRRMPSQARSRSLVEAVLEAFDREVASSEPDDITIEKLSDRAGVGVGSFYEYFSNKDSLLGAFIGRVTRENYNRLTSELNAHRHAELDDLIRAFVASITATYMTHPRRMRVLVDGIVRLGLLHAVNRERDRFADVMADKARLYYTDADVSALQRTMRIIADASMGIFVACTSRGAAPPLDVLADEIAELAIATLHRRHGTPRRLQGV